MYFFEMWKMNTQHGALILWQSRLLHASRWIHALLLLYFSFKREILCKDNYFFRGSLFCNPDHLTWMELDQPDRPGQRTVVAYIISLNVCLSLKPLFQRILLRMNLNHLWSWCVFLPPDAQTVKRIGRLVIRRVCVPELDQRFSDMAETFNEQQERYEAMVRHIRNVRQTYGCNHNDTLALAECVGKIREEHGKWHSELPASTDRVI